MGLGSAGARKVAFGSGGLVLGTIGFSGSFFSKVEIRLFKFLPLFLFLISSFSGSFTALFCF